jgi:uncharacterized protein YjbJ (UPF0337 family)
MERAKERAPIILQEKHIMSSTTDKIEGVANEIAGKTKQAAGKSFGDHKLRADGVDQEAKGDAQKAAGDFKDTVKKLIDNA